MFRAKDGLAMLMLTIHLTSSKGREIIPGGALQHLYYPIYHGTQMSVLQNRIGMLVILRH
jgi:hypothetical protein